MKCYFRNTCTLTDNNVYIPSYIHRLNKSNTNVPRMRPDSLQDYFFTKNPDFSSTKLAWMYPFRFLLIWRNEKIYDSDTSTSRTMRISTLSAMQLRINHPI